jgi:hypothetical protein
MNRFYTKSTLSAVLLCAAVTAVAGKDPPTLRKDGVITFADIQKGDGKLVPVSFVIEKSHSSLRRKQL